MDNTYVIGKQWCETGTGRIKKMATILARKQMGSGELIIVETSSRNGGQYRRPAILRLARMKERGTEWTTVNSPAVDSVLDWYKVDSRNTGPRSGYGQALSDLKLKMDAVSKMPTSGELAHNIG